MQEIEHRKDETDGCRDAFGRSEMPSLLRALSWKWLTTSSSTMLKYC
jgi:hypothetical protein